MVQFNPEEITGYENPNNITTIKKLTNPLEINGEGQNTPRQIGETLKSTNSVQDNFYSGYISATRQYAIKHCFLKVFIVILLSVIFFQIYIILTKMGLKRYFNFILV